MGTGGTLVIRSATGPVDSVLVGMPGRPLPVLRLWALDADGRAVPGAQVRWAVQGVQARLEAAQTVTAEDGSFSAVWVLGTKASERQKLAVEVSTGGHRAEIRLRAVAVPAEVVNLMLKPDTTVVKLGGSGFLTAEATDSFGNRFAPSGVRFTSLDTAVTEVDSTGKLQPRRRGYAGVAAVAAGAAGAGVVQVIQAVGAIRVDADTLRFHSLGETRRLTVTLVDDQGAPIADSLPTASIADSSVARLGTTGPYLVTSLTNGSSTIELRVGALSRTVRVVVRQVVTRVEVSPARDTVNVGHQRLLRAVAFDSNSVSVSDATFAWHSADTTIATADSAGTVQARYAGLGSITATSGSVQGTAVIVAVPRPVTAWLRNRYSGNPVVSPAVNPGDTISSYGPAPIRLENGDIWVYVKGDGARAIWAYRSTDGGETFTVQGEAVSRGGQGEWDAEYVFEPAAVYDRANQTIHLWYKGTDDPQGETNWSWGHATASASDPARFQKDPVNPILRPQDIELALGETGISDNAISSVIKVGDRFYFFGYFSSGSGYKIFYATGNGWNDPVPRAVIMTPRTGFDLVQSPSVFRHPDGAQYGMIYTEGFVDQSLERHLVAAQSLDGTAWQRLDGAVLATTNISWEYLRVYGASLLKASVQGFADLELVNGTFLLYYSGSGQDYDATGLLFLKPN